MGSWSITEDRMLLFGLISSSKNRITSSDPSFNANCFSSAESIKSAAFSLVLPKSKQRVVEFKHCDLTGKASEMVSNLTSNE